MTDNMRGSLFMILSMAGFAVEDAFIKAAARQMPVGQVLIVMALVGMAAFAAQARRAGDPPLPRGVLSRTMALRSGFELAGRLLYALAIALTPISTASAILQATPLVVVLGAALVFGERVSPGRWAVIALGFAGVLVILRPGLDGFDMLSLLAIGGMLGFAGRDLATRAAPPALSNAQLGVAGFAVLGVSGLVILSVTGGATLPSVSGAGLLAGACGFGILGYGALTVAMRTGEVSAVTPFRYTRLLFAMVLGIGVFGERPDGATLIGAAMIVGCGVLILGRRRRPA
ncbi:MAG: DMT family transporter [Rhodobacteraceae bacterium]|nr:DMT family transporter [Paracoccaceae bacterium]